MIDLSHFSFFFVANWKLNSSFEFINNFISSLNIDKSTKKCVSICAPYIYLNYLKDKRKDYYSIEQNKTTKNFCKNRFWI